jgi:hypothetical protein
VTFEFEVTQVGQDELDRYYKDAWITVDDTPGAIIERVKPMFSGLIGTEHAVALKTIDGLRISPVFDSFKHDQVVLVKAIEQEPYDTLSPWRQPTMQPSKIVTFNLSNTGDLGQVNTVRLDISFYDTADSILAKVLNISGWVDPIAFQYPDGARFSPTFDTVEEGMTIAALGQRDFTAWTHGPSSIPH